MTRSGMRAASRGSLTARAIPGKNRRLRAESSQFDLLYSGTMMRLRTMLAALAVAVASFAQPAAGASFRFAFQGDLNSLDPYSLYEGFTLGVPTNVYEGLVRRGAKLEIQPGLAERWEVL